jgi:hypothetical protein
MYAIYMDAVPTNDLPCKGREDSSLGKEGNPETLGTNTSKRCEHSLLERGFL